MGKAKNQSFYRVNKVTPPLITVLEGTYCIQDKSYQMDSGSHGTFTGRKDRSVSKGIFSRHLS